MKEAFKWGKFILDCLICLMLMIVSYIILFFPVFFIVGYLFIGGVLIHLMGIKSINILNGFGEFSLFFTLSHTLFFVFWFFLEKKNLIKYRIYKPSFWFCFILLTSYWWYVAYWLSRNFK